jgi:NitT/TauT family transport system ATP-binding protein
MSRPDVENCADKIRLDGVRKEFQMGQDRKGRLIALQNVDIAIKKGEFVCIVGPTGCGKTTILNIIAGLVKPDRGRVLVNGREVDGPAPDRVMMFQEAALFPWLTVIENVEFGLEMQGVGRAERRKRAEKHLGLVRLSHFRDSFVHELSGGMKQRVALARALAMDPDILLMDEPFAALDAQTRDRFHLELQQIWMKTKKTILFVTHNVSEAVCLGDRVLVLSYRPGRIKKEFKVDRPRPREYRTTPELAGITAMVLDELREEVDKAIKEEMG